MTAVGRARDLTLPAMTCRWLLHLDFRLGVKGNGRFSAMNLKGEISGPGQELSFAYSELLPFKRLLRSQTRQRSYASHSASAAREDRLNSPLSSLGSKASRRVASVWRRTLPPHVVTHAPYQHRLSK